MEKLQKKEAEKQEALNRWLEKLQEKEAEKQELIFKYEKRNTIALYQELHDINRTARILSISPEKVKEYLKDTDSIIDE